MNNTDRIVWAVFVIGFTIIVGLVLIMFRLGDILEAL